jgi:hypothetical protein
VSLEREIVWATSIFLLNSDRLNDFLNLKRTIEHLLLTERSKDALTVLEEYCEHGGTSFWALELRQFLIQSTAGLQEQKAFTQSIRGAKDLNSRNYILFHSSIRVEPTTHVFTFSNDAAEHLDSYIEPSSFRNWLKFRIYDFRPSTPEEAADIIRSEHASPLIDLYETFIRIGATAIAYNQPFGTDFLREFAKLASVLHDVRIYKALSLTEDGSRWLDLIPICATAVSDLYYGGNNDQLPSTATESLARDETGAEVLEYIARATIEKGSLEPTVAGSVVTEVVSDLRRLYSADFSLSSFINLARMALNLRFLPLASEILLASWREVSHRPTPDRAIETREFILSSRLQPRHISLFPESRKEQLAEYLLRRLGPSATMTIESIRAGLTPDNTVMSTDKAVQPTVKAHLTLASLTALADKQDWHELAAPALILYNCLIEPALRREAACLHAHALLNSAPLAEFVDFIVNAYLLDEALLFRFPMADCVSLMDKHYRKAQAGELSTPIALHMNCQINPDGESLRSYAYEDFLIAHGVDRPSELGQYLPRLDKAQLVYYLRHICVLDVMQMSSAFAGTQQLEDERVAICALLSQLDSENAKEYESESRAITQQQVIRRGVKQVEESKIYVDTNALGRWADKNLKESFTRYQALRNAGMEATPPDLLKSIREVLSGSVSKSSALELPKNEVTTLLVSIVKKLSIEFLSNPEHGLDCYLSMRIRHGALAGQLRASLEKQKITTQRSSGSDEYKTNSFWRSQLWALPDYAWSQIDSCLKEFSRQYDNLIDTYCNDYMQIYGSDKPRGLFNLSFSEVSLVLLADAIKTNTTLDQFLACIIHEGLARSAFGGTRLVETMSAA